jgi:hypothetical protein
VSAVVADIALNAFTCSFLNTAYIMSRIGLNTVQVADHIEVQLGTYVLYLEHFRRDREMGRKEVICYVITVSPKYRV